MAHAPNLVLIHDVVRPFVTTDVIGRVIAALATQRRRHCRLAALRYFEARRHSRPHFGNSRPPRPVACTNPTGLPLRRHPRRPSQGGLAPSRADRRRRRGRARRPHRCRRRGVAQEHQDHHAGGHRHGAGRALRRHGDPHRARLRRPSVSPQATTSGWARSLRPHPHARRPLRCRRRPPRPHRRHPRRHRRRRHRPALPALRPPLEGRVLTPVPGRRPAGSCASKAAASATSMSRSVRGPPDRGRIARSCAGALPTFWASGPLASASRRRPPRDWASPAGAKASPLLQPRRWLCGRRPQSTAHRQMPHATGPGDGPAPPGVAISTEFAA